MYRNITLLKHIYRFEFVRRLSNMNDTKRVAICQMTSVADKSTNLQVVSQLISDAAKENVQMVFFPEACDYICDNKKDVVGQAEPILTGNIVNKYRQLAAEHSVWLSMGGIHEKDESNPTKMFNTHLIIDDKGNIVQSYRKLHLFDVEIPEKNVRLKESDFSNAGRHIVTPVESPVGRIGMAICYDMRFPELSTSLSIMGAEILTFPSAFTQATGAAHWHVLLRSRAIENQCYVIAAAQTGEHNAKRRSYGHAICIDPWGEVVADCGDSSPTYKVAEISPRKLADVRRNMPVFQHRRRDVYSLYTLSLRKSVLPEHNETPSIDEKPTDCTTDEECNVFGHVRVPNSCIFYKSKLSYAFVNLRCVIPGHVLVAPIRMAERNKDLSDEEAEDFYRTVRTVQKLMEKVHNTESCTVTIQDGPDAGQTVKHLHCHIMPRKKGDFIENDLIYLELAKHDQFKRGHPSKPPRSLEEMRTEAELLRNELDKMLNEDKVSSR
ncbi:nitrilase and fragile histidine triad fusion protein NitFhit isoform X2 [Galleria mellonella]|uniref:Nitrilase and fragile histidine triad fusion protein NitFhit n=1 Tax=Galleria mellonella TaxID=7137 RepID=A0A6J3BUU5_GALME|nr:nitrilase and fragile histidine triad fusion protein NitFhit isoform X2 [Galleria mellonella]XP_031764142.1 nitrilase and fragile histidine triad fusion protein NitFhit isoform X2 [Galleria mellonella]XP_052749080.1 nitrilase and fragile histidine triad fusion protein NitFhit isoform X2 [Galleria mellonella]